MSATVINFPASRRRIEALAFTESLSARKGSEKSKGLHFDHRGTTQARSSEGGIGGKECPPSLFQSREPVDSNPVSGGASSSEPMKCASGDDLAPAVTEFEFTPHATLLERYRHRLTDQQLAELVRVTLEECA